MNIYEKIFRELNKEKIKYLVVGGVAVNVHGYPRFTADLDILLSLDEKNLEKLDKVMGKLGYTPRLPIMLHDLSNTKQVKDWLKIKNFKAFTFNPSKNSLLQIDIVIEESLRFNDFYKKRVNKKFENVNIPVAHINDIIKMKKNTDRKKDFEDLEALIKLKNL